MGDITELARELTRQPDYQKILDELNFRQSKIEMLEEKERKEMRAVSIQEEDLRDFFIKRPWLHGERGILDHERYVINNSQYESLKRRDGKFFNNLNLAEKSYLEGFLSGWRWAKA